MTRSRIAHIVERQGQVIEITRLAVTPPEAREDTENLDVALNSDQIEPTQELAIGETRSYPTGPASASWKSMTPVSSFGNTIRLREW